jgi:hypothetical protein
MCLFFPGSDVKHKKGATSILYGMDNGALSAVTVLPDGTHTHQWTVDDAVKRSQITCTNIYVITLSRFLELFDIF